MSVNPTLVLRRSVCGYTLVEMLISASLFALIIIAIMACHFAGLRFNQFIQPKLVDAQYARKTLEPLIEEVRCANSLQVGTGSLTAFTVAGVTNLQAGNALRIFQSTNSSQFIYYYLDSASSYLYKIPVAGSTNAIVVASGVTNATVFTLEDFQGRALTNSQNNAVMSILMQIHRDSTWRGIGDNIQVRTKVTRRNIL